MGPPGGLWQQDHPHPCPGLPGSQGDSLRQALRCGLPHGARPGRPSHGPVDHVIYGLGTPAPRRCDPGPAPCPKWVRDRRGRGHPLLHSRGDELRPGVSGLLLQPEPGRFPGLQQDQARVMGHSRLLASRIGPRRSPDLRLGHEVAGAPLQRGLLPLHRHLGPPRAVGRPFLLHGTLLARLRRRDHRSSLRSLARGARVNPGEGQEGPRGPTAERSPWWTPGWGTC